MRTAATGTTRAATRRIRPALCAHARLPAPVESAAYFTVSELLANVVKHAGALEVSVRIRLAGDRLTVTVADDGSGGADPATGTGLRGIQRRLAAFGGLLTIDSPPGGPTEITLELPCAS